MDFPLRSSEDGHNSLYTSSPPGEGSVTVVGGSRDDDLLGSALQVSTSLVSGCEYTGGFDDVFSSGIRPFDVDWVTLAEDGDGLFVDVKLAVFGLDGSLESTVHLIADSSAIIFAHDGRRTESYLNM